MVLVCTMASELRRRTVSDEQIGHRMCLRRTLKLGSASHEMRLAPQRHLASVYTIVEIFIKGIEAWF
jgi:hypothetical protein